MPTVHRTRPAREAVATNPLPRVGLTSRQAWAMEHITRCPICGKWVLVGNDRTLAQITSEDYVAPAVCAHFQPTAAA